MFLVSLVAVSTVGVVEAVGTANIATLSSYASVYSCPFALRATKSKSTLSLSLSGSI